VLRSKLESLLRNTQKSFNKFGGLLSETEQEAAERCFVDAEAATKTESIEQINKALDNLERTATQLTSAMMNPAVDTTTGV